MHELVETQPAPPPIIAPHSASNALHSGPCVRIGPSRTRITARRSSSVIQGRPNGISRRAGVSVIVFDPHWIALAKGAVGRHAGRDHGKLVLGADPAVGAV